jgi:tRNA (cmo5U34)-methyltransferase
MKMTPEQIRERFDRDVERFSNLETGQSATMDAPLVLELITEAAAATTPQARAILDVGCGAGNYSLKLLQALTDRDITLVDLSEPMLQRAREWVGAATRGEVRILQGDIRTVDVGEARHDIIVAAAVLHHLRDEAEWRDVFAKLFAALRPGGSLWIADLVAHSVPAVETLTWRRYGEYLTERGGDGYRDEVFAYIEREDTPRPLLFQIDLLRCVGFRDVEVLHKNTCFAAFGALKA